MKILKQTSRTLLFICLIFLLGCGDSKKSKEAVEDSSTVLSEDHFDPQGKDHAYDITINPGSSNERHLKGEIKNAQKEDGTINNFSAYSPTENGKGIVLRIGNDDILIDGLFFSNNDGTTTDLFDGSEDDSEEKSRLIISIAPPSEDVHNSMSGHVKLSNITSALESDEGGVIGYTLAFDGQFEDYADHVSQIKGTVVVRIPKYL